VWNGVHKGIPGGCSVRKHSDGHYDKRGLQATVGEKRNDLRAVCKGLPYYITELNENCQVTRNVITSKAECAVALKAVGKSDRFVWNGVHKGIPGGCSVRKHSDGHYDNRGLKATVGEKRKDLRAVCKRVTKIDSFLETTEERVVATKPFGSFLENTEGHGNTAQLLAQINAQQGEGASKVTRSHLRASAIVHPISYCQNRLDDFAVWFRIGTSVSYGTGTAGGGISANLGIAFGCDGHGTMFMFPTIDVGVEMTAGANVGNDAGELDWSMGVDLFANYDGTGRQGSNSLLRGGTGKPTGKNDKSVWGAKLGWGLGAALNVGIFSLGFSFTMPQLEIGTDSVFGFEVPTSAGFLRPRLAGVGISGDAVAIFKLLTTKRLFIEQFKELGTKKGIKATEFSLSVAIGYVGIIGGKTTNWFSDFDTLLGGYTHKPAKAASCNNFMSDFPKIDGSKYPSHIYDCGANVFEALPQTLLPKWPYN